jgi:heme A synthase
LGALVTSFRVGMADPVWPTRPWHLFTIDWTEPKPGYLIEHTHRLVGFVVGGSVAILALGLWLTERRAALRWSGVFAVVALLVAFGQLHATLINQQQLYRDVQERITSPTQVAVVPQPDWRLAAGPTAAALALLGLATLAGLIGGSPGRGVRALGSVLLVGVMAQGLVGGLRVYLDALLGTQLATTHGIFSQVVLALAVATVIALRPRSPAPADDRMQRETAALRWTAITAVLVFGQIIAGAMMRHTSWPVGPRLHLLLAFVVVAAIIAMNRHLADAPRTVRGIAGLLYVAIGLQLLLGVEAWVHKYAFGFARAPVQSIGFGDAAIRSAHAVMGYIVFALACAMAFELRLATRPHRDNNTRPERINLELESVA